MKRPFLAFTISLTLTATATVFAAPALDLKSQLTAAANNGDAEAVAEILRRLHSDKPKDTDTLKALLRAELSINNIDSARVLAAKLEQIVSADDPALLECRGDLALRDKKNEEAVSAWQAALKGSPEDAELLSKLAMHFLNTEKNAATAAVYFEQLLKLRSNANDHILVATVAIAMRDWTTLIERMTALKTQFATDSTGQKWIPAFERVAIHATSQIAELDAKEKTEADPVPTILRRSRLFLEDGFPDLALNDARRALKLAPHVLHVRFYFAAAAARLWEDTEMMEKWGMEWYPYRQTPPDQQFLDKLAAFDTALADRPTDPDALIGRADLLYMNKQQSLARADAQALLEGNPEHPQALRLLAMINAEDGYYGKAVEQADKARAILPDDLQVLSAATYVHGAQGNFDLVITLCDHWLMLEKASEPAAERRATAIKNLQKN